MVEVGGRQMTVSLDAAPPVTRHAQALVSARVVDETTGLPPRVALTLEAEEKNVVPRVAEGGLVGFAGIPQQAFPLLNMSDSHIHMTLTARGFLTYRRLVTVLMDATFPSTYNALDLGVIELHRVPVVLRGRVTRQMATGPVGAAGVAVRVSGMWRTPPPAAAPPPPAPPNMVSLRTGAVLERTAATGSVVRRDLAPSGAPDKALEAEAEPGSTTVRISDRVGINVGDVIGIDVDDPDLTEYGTITSIAGGASVNEAATVEFVSPLTLRHPRGAVASMLTAAAAGAANGLVEPIAAGDRCALVASMTGLAGASVVEVSGGGPPASELIGVQLYEAVTGADGFYRLPPLSRVAQVVVTADDGMNPAVDVRWRIDYTSVENRLDISIS